MLVTSNVFSFLFLHRATFDLSSANAFSMDLPINISASKEVKLMAGQKLNVFADDKIIVTE